MVSLFYTYATTCSIFFFNDTATTEIYTLSLHDALPICVFVGPGGITVAVDVFVTTGLGDPNVGVKDGVGEIGVVEIDVEVDRKSTRLNSSHSQISYAVFCLKNKKIRYMQSLCVLR